jgi:hypothetical protein
VAAQTGFDGDGVGGRGDFDRDSSARQQDIEKQQQEEK